MSLTKKELARFYSNKPRAPTRVIMGGNKVAFANLPKDLQVDIKERLAERDPVMAEGLKGILPGIKIDGKQVSRDNIHEFELKNRPEVKKEIVKEVKVEPVKETPKVSAVKKKKK